MTGWATISAGVYDNCATRIDGTALRREDNADGEPGDGTQLVRHAPVQVGVATNWATIASGEDHSCATRHRWQRLVLGRQQPRSARCHGTRQAADDARPRSARRQGGGSSPQVARTAALPSSTASPAAGETTALVSSETGVRRAARCRGRSSTPPGGSLSPPGLIDTCGVSVKGVAWCWADNRWASRDGTGVDSDVPVRVGNPHD